MKRTTYEIAEKVINKMDKLEKTIFELQDLVNTKEHQKVYKIVAQSTEEINLNDKMVELKEGDIATEVFIQDILEYYINTLNLELDELKKELETL